MADVKSNEKALYSDRAIRLGGFALAHAAFSVSELPQPLIPFGVLEKSGFFGPRREINRFAAPTYELSVEAGRGVIAEKKSKFQSWTLVYDGYMRPAASDTRTDAFIVEVDDATMQAPLKVLQAYQPFSSGTFKLMGAPVFTLMDHPAVEPALAARLNKKLLEGVRSHRQAKKRWPTWVS